MKIIKSKPKCAKCGSWKIFAHCQSILVCGCDKYFCLICWPDHSKMHDKEWQDMPQEEKDKLING